MLWENRDLLFNIIKRDVSGRYRGSILGTMWALFNPLLMLFVYSFVFGFVFKSKWAGAADNIFEYTIILYAGLIVYNVFVEVIGRSSTIVLNNAVYVKKVVFPLEILPWSLVGTMLFNFVMNFIVLLALYMLVNHSLDWSFVFLPLILAPLIMMTVGVSWFLSSLGVYVRDTSQVVGIVVAVLLFLSPVFYPVTVLPESIRSIMFLNPLAFIIEEFRSVMIWHTIPNFVGLGIYSIVSMIVAWSGFCWFQKTRSGFADVI